jgi:MFS transporter, PAT family, beta-lactamase induction signal transducer AmpG
MFPNLVYVAFAIWQPASLWWVTSGVVVEQFGYGFGFTAYMLYMIYFADGPNKTAHYAICTGFMALGMMLPGMVSGWIQEQTGYQWFYVWVVICTLPGFALLPFMKIDPAFGTKRDNKKESFHIIIIVCYKGIYHITGVCFSAFDRMLANFDVTPMDL